jgi:hypothetical protein
MNRGSNALGRCLLGMSWFVAVSSGWCDEALPDVAEPVVAPKEPPHDAAEPASAELSRIVEQAERVTRQLEQARDKLKARDTGADTQQLQRDILAALDELLKQPPRKQKPPPPSSPEASSGSGQASAGSSSSKPMPMPRDGQPSEGQAEQPAESSPQPQPNGERERADAEGSEERTGERRGGPVPLPRRRLEVDVWGHLPEKVRERLLNAYGERMVPQYEDLVQRFYRSLAETSSKSEPDGRP